MLHLRVAKLKNLSLSEMYYPQYTIGMLTFINVTLRKISKRVIEILHMKSHSSIQNKTSVVTIYLCVI